MGNKDARLLVVDDESYVREVLARYVGAEGYTVDQAASGEEAWQMLAEDSFDLVITDIMMPGMSGMDLLQRIQEERANVGVIMVTAVNDRGTAIEAVDYGAYGYIMKPFNQDELAINVANALERLRLSKLREQYEEELEREVRQRTGEIRRREEEIAIRLISAAEYRDDETGSHIRRMGLCAKRMATELGWGEIRCDDLRIAGAMHDIGKIGIPDSVLLKPGKLTSAEREIIKTHTEIGARLLSGSDVPLLQVARDIALSHHERWDGTGYPRALGEKDIPETGRLVAIVDVYDALTHDRVYRPAMSEEEALEIMDEGRGSHFDPEFYDMFRDLLPQLRDIRHNVAENEDLLAPAATPVDGL
jgi:putative two-component system response regulator